MLDANKNRICLGHVTRYEVKDRAVDTLRVVIEVKGLFRRVSWWREDETDA
jgi:hypothetical protein